MVIIHNVLPGFHNDVRILHERELGESLSVYLRSALQCSSSRQIMCRLVDSDGGYRHWALQMRSDFGKAPAIPCGLEMELHPVLLQSEDNGERARNLQADLETETRGYQSLICGPIC